MSELGIKVKEMCEARGLNMTRYDPSSEKYTPWYGVPMRVEYSELPETETGRFNLKKRLM